MSNARNIVICTPELLELILSGLPMRYLLVTAPLVSKTWQALTLTPPYSAPSLPPRSLKLRRWSWPDAEAIQSMPWAKAPEVFKRREASWRRMLVIQPPAPEMIVTEHCHARHGDFERSGVLDDPCLRMGVLY
ncbi:hypothetical protein B0H14DRAFT_3426947 [Mycena olivaceomarginata]|nr:hypothetical protein B0H14DRAFT_3426947 [Mycena olivaceomarginata]